MEAFVYCWTDHRNQKLYVGSHKGTENDGYKCSSKLVLQELSLRPDVSIRNKQNNPALLGYSGRSMQGQLNPMFGRKHSNSAKFKMSQNSKGVRNGMYGKRYLTKQNKKCL